MKKQENNKYKPFNLEEAKAGRPVCTRNGQEVRIICFDAKSENYPIVALVKEGYSTQEYLRTYTNEGEVCRNGLMHTLDLVMSLKKKTGWINIYHVDGEDTVSGIKCIYTTEKDARTNAIISEAVDTIQIEWYE